MTGGPPRWHLALLITLVLIAGAAISTIMAGSALHVSIATAVCILAPLLGLGWLVYARRFIHIRRERYSWRFILYSICTAMLGKVYWLITVAFHYPPPPIALDQLAVLASYVFLWIGLTARPGRFPRDFMERAMLVCDIAVAVGAAISIAVHLSLQALMFSGHSYLTLIVLGAIYPIFALITLIDVIFMLFHTVPRHQHGPRAILVLGVCTLVTGNLVFAYLHLTGHPTDAYVAGALGMIGMALYGVAALWEAAQTPTQSKRPRVIDPFPSFVGFIVPILLVFCALLLSVRCCMGLEPGGIQHLGFTFTSLTLLISLVMIRQILTFMSNRHLYMALQQLYTEMASNAVTDVITGLTNHRYFIERFTKEMRRATRYNRPISLIFADLDYFKRINDSYGHDAGDRALQAAADCLRKCLRDTDVLARYGGEEFVVLLPETTLAQAEILAERLRQAIEALHIPLRGETVLNMTISCGVAAYPTTADTMEDLLRSADQAMYQAKQVGRNRVRVAPPLATDYSSHANSA
ncbi:MAG: GGDEF domain-containing protein [Armatimonadota bacterium]